MTVGIDDYPYASGHRCAADSSHKCSILISLCANSERTRLSSYTLITNVDIVFSGCEVCSGQFPYSDIAIAACVGFERRNTNSRGLPASGVDVERAITIATVRAGRCASSQYISATS